MADTSFDEIIENAASVLGCNKLRDFQRSAAAGILKGHDVLVSQPTGSGKSLTFQLLPFAVVRPIVQMQNQETLKNDFVLVISPLVSLIRDQVTKLRAMGIVCLTLDDEFTLSYSIQERSDLYLLHPKQSLTSIVNYTTPVIFETKERLDNS
eukprot:gene14768-16308_t